MLVAYALPVSGKLTNSKIGYVGSAGAPPASLAGTASSSDASSRGRSGRPGVAAAAPPPPPGQRGQGEEGQCGIVFWLDAVSTTFLLEVELAACTKSQISMCAERGAWGGGTRLLPIGGSPTRRRYAQEGGGEGSITRKCLIDCLIFA